MTAALGSTRAENVAFCLECLPPNGLKRAKNEKICSLFNIFCCCIFEGLHPTYTYINSHWLAIAGCI